MATIYGEVLMLTVNGLHHPVNAEVVSRQDRRIIGQGRVDDDNRFTIDVADDERGLIEIEIGLHDAATSETELDGSDAQVVVLYNPVNNYFA